jgi:SAM-dependent methyltransferase
MRPKHDRPSRLNSQTGWNPSEHYLDETVAGEYDVVRFSNFAARIYLPLERHYLLKAFSGVKPGSLILDAPCGTGRLAEVLLKAGYDVVGVDISPAMLQVAARRLASFGTRFQTAVCDARELPKLGRRFDAALCARVLMHFPVPEQIKFLGGVAAVSDGPVVFTQSYDSGYQRFRRSIKRLLRHQTPAVYPISKEDLGQLLRGANLHLVHRYHLLPPVSEAIVVVTSKEASVRSRVS